MTFPASATNYDVVSNHAGNNESFVTAKPNAGTYYMAVVAGTGAYANVSAQGSYVAPVAVSTSVFAATGRHARTATTSSPAVINYITADQLGTPRAVSDPSGNVIWQWAYQGNPFGEQQPTSTTGYVLNLRYPGQYFDAETRTNYNMFRTYEPVSGRYLQSDPSGLPGGISTYSYVSDAPTNYIDLDGLSQTSGPRAPSSHSWKLPPGAGGAYGQGVPGGQANQSPANPEATPGAWGAGDRRSVQRCTQGFCAARMCTRGSASSVWPLAFQGRPPSMYPIVGQIPAGCTCTQWTNSDDIPPLPEPSATTDDAAELAAKLLEMQKENQKQVEESLRE